MSIAEFYLMNSRYYNGGIDMGLDFYNPFDDYYDDYHSYNHSDYSDYMDSDSLDGMSEDFLELCLLPNSFPDPKKFPIEWARRSMKIRAHNYHPLTALPAEERGARHRVSGIFSENLSEKLEIPILEQLWECLFYLKEITSVGVTRVECSNIDCDMRDEMVKDIWINSIECFSIFCKDAKELSDHWFGWCNDLYLETIQSYIPSTLPYIVWNSIISHLSKTKYSENRALQTVIGTVSEDKETQIIERFLARECILRIGDLTRLFNRILYSELDLKEVTLSKLKGTLPSLFRGLTLSMGRLQNFLEKCDLENMSEFVDYSVLSCFSTHLSTFVKNGRDVEAFQSDLDILKMVQADTVCQNNANYFTVLIADNLLEKVYHLLCIDKDSIDSNENMDHFLFDGKALLSEEPPYLFCYGDLVLGIGLNRHGSIEFTLWDMLARSRIFNLSTIEKGWRDAYPEIGPISLSNLRIGGMIKCESKFFMMCAVGESCLMSIYDIFDGQELRTPEQKQVTFLENAVPLGIHGATAFVMNLQQDVLTMYDIGNLENGFVCDNEINFKSGKDWKMVFNGNPKSEFFILHKGSDLQIRRHDHDLTLVRELTINQPHCLSTSSTIGTLELHLFGNMVYGVKTSDSSKMLNVNKEFLAKIDKVDQRQSTLINFLLDRFIENSDEHFLVDISSAKKEPISIDWGSYDGDHSHNNIVEDLFSSKVKIETTQSGFNRKGELVKVTINADGNKSLFDSVKEVVICKCSEFFFASAKVINSIEEAKGINLPSVQRVFDMLKKEEEDRAALKMEQEMLKKRLEEEHQKRKKVKENVRKTVEEYIESGATVKATIKKWMFNEGYGFATIEIDPDEGEDGKQDIFVHKTCVSVKERKRLHAGASIHCQLIWDSHRPRPKATNVKLL